MDRSKSVVRALVALTLLSVGALLAVDVGAAPGRGVLFGTDGNGGNLLRIDEETGAGTIIGNMGTGQGIPSLAVDPTTGTMYAGGGGGGPNLYTVDKTTGAATLVGDSGLGFAAIGALDFRKDGVLFGAVNVASDGGSGSDHLAWFDETTGAATVIGPFGTCTGVTVPTSGGGTCSIDGMEAIAFDKKGKLWGALRSSPASAGAVGLYRIDPSTGAATFVGPIVHKKTGLPPSGGVVSLQFDCKGELLGGTGRVAGGSDSGMLIELKKNKKGKFEFEGTVPATTGGLPLAALAFDDRCKK